MNKIKTIQAGNQAKHLEKELKHIHYTYYKRGIEGQLDINSVYGVYVKKLDASYEVWMDCRPRGTLPLSHPKKNCIHVFDIETIPFVNNKEWETQEQEAWHQAWSKVLDRLHPKRTIFGQFPSGGYVPADLLYHYGTNTLFPKKSNLKGASNG
jgi:hypothetical protein